MLLSKKIADYFEAKLADLKPDRVIPFSVHLYFEKSDHVMLWRAKEERISAEFLEKYLSRGANRIWIHNSEAAAYAAYLKGPEAAPAAPQEARTPEAQKILDAIAAPTLAPEQKEAIVAETAQKALAEVAKPETHEEQAQATQKARKIVRDVLEGAQDSAESTTSEIWRLANIDPTFEHAVNVSTYAVLFALAFGRIDMALMTDLALAGLLHDVGLSQMPTDISSVPWKKLSAPQLDVYKAHVEEGLALLKDYAPDASARVRTIISQHHEKFDGTGYPAKLQGFQVDDVAQLVCIADLLDSIAGGQWDGERRTLGETLDQLEHLEKQRTFPEHFNPDVFSVVMKWTRNPDSARSTAEAVAVVRKETQHIIDEQRAGADEKAS